MTQEITCEFCKTPKTVSVPWYGEIKFVAGNGEYCITVMVLKNTKRDDSGKVIEAITKHVCLRCLKEFIQNAKDIGE